MLGPCKTHVLVLGWFLQSLEFFMKTVMSSISRHGFISSFLMFYVFYFSFFIALVRTFNTTLKGFVKEEILALILILGVKHLLFHTVYDVSCRVLVDAFLSGKGISLLFLTCLHFFIMNGDVEFFQILFFHIY